MAVEVNSDVSAHQSFLMKGDSSGDNLPYLINETSSGIGAIVDSALYGSPSILASGSNNNVILEFDIQASGSNSLVAIYLNGINQTLSSSTISNALINYNDDDALGWLLGADYDSTSINDFFNGDMYEIMFFDGTVSDENAYKIRYYLSQKWGLTDTVDSDGDGLTDAEEEALGIDPADNDSDDDSLVMVDFINRYRSDGNDITQAVLEAGPRRFRAIFLASLTTFVGLIPLLLEKSVQAKFIVPMAVSLSFGVIFATFITLLLVPVFYLVLEKYIIKSDITITQN